MDWLIAAGARLGQGTNFQKIHRFLPWHHMGSGCLPCFFLSNYFWIWIGWVGSSLFFAKWQLSQVSSSVVLTSLAPYTVVSLEWTAFILFRRSHRRCHCISADRSGGWGQFGVWYMIIPMSTGHNEPTFGFYDGFMMVLYMVLWWIIMIVPNVPLLWGSWSLFGMLGYNWAGSH